MTRHLNWDASCSRTYGIKAPSDGLIEIMASRNPEGHYSDAAGGIKMGNYVVPAQLEMP